MVDVPTHKRMIPAAAARAMAQGVPQRHAVAGAKPVATGARVTVGK